MPYRVTAPMVTVRASDGALFQFYEGAVLGAADMPVDDDLGNGPKPLDANDVERLTREGFLERVP